MVLTCDKSRRCYWAAATWRIPSAPQHAPHQAAAPLQPAHWRAHYLSRHQDLLLRCSLLLGAQVLLSCGNRLGALAQQSSLVWVRLILCGLTQLRADPAQQVKPPKFGPLLLGCGHSHNHLTLLHIRQLLGWQERRALGQWRRRGALLLRGRWGLQLSVVTTSGINVPDCRPPRQARRPSSSLYRPIVHLSLRVSPKRLSIACGSPAPRLPRSAALTVLPALLLPLVQVLLADLDRALASGYPGRVPAVWRAR